MILGIETTTKIGSLAIVNNGRILIEEIIDTKLNHAANLISILDKILTKIKLDIRSINIIAIDTGPGSFTGIRVGIASSRGLAELDKKILVNICSLEVLAYEFVNSELLKNDCEYVIPFIDAKRGRIYTACYKNINKELKVEKEPYLATLQNLICNKDISPNSCILGPDINLIENGSFPIKGKGIIEKPIFPKASAVALLAENKIKEEGFREKNIEPMYLHDVEYKTTK